MLQLDLRTEWISIVVVFRPADLMQNDTRVLQESANKLGQHVELWSTELSKYLIINAVDRRPKLSQACDANGGQIKQNRAPVGYIGFFLEKSRLRQPVALSRNERTRHMQRASNTPDTYSVVTSEPPNRHEQRVLRPCHAKLFSQMITQQFQANR